MNEYFAAHPQSCSGASDLRYLLSLFGPQTGRYLADLPASWQEDVLRHCAQMGDLEAERVKSLVRRAREKSALLRKAWPHWQPGLDWLSNYRHLLAAQPAAFDGAIVPKGLAGSGLTAIDDLELPATASEAIDATAAEYVRVCRTLLLISQELVVVDPYLNPCKRDRAEVLLALLSVLGKSTARKSVTCWARSSEVVDVKRNSWAEVCAALDSILSKAGWPKTHAFRYILVDDAVAKSRMHARHVFSIKGGIRFDQGLQVLPRGRRNEVSPTAHVVHEELIATFVDGQHDMAVEHTYTR
jgi:hypothetical protein